LAGQDAGQRGAPECGDGDRGSGQLGELSPRYSRVISLIDVLNYFGHVRSFQLCNTECENASVDDSPR